MGFASPVHERVLDVPICFFLHSCPNESTDNVPEDSKGPTRSLEKSKVPRRFPWMAVRGYERRFAGKAFEHTHALADVLWFHVRGSQNRATGRLHIGLDKKRKE